ncbi:MAG: hypothetical protein ACOYL3_14115 [Desulfuromonadaceae bacterium]
MNLHPAQMTDFVSGILMMCHGIHGTTGATGVIKGKGLHVAIFL